MLVPCPRCHSTNPPDSPVCSKCGTRLIALDEAFDSRTVTLADQPEEIRAGTVLKGKYRILGNIGSGGMGVVYKAEDIRLKRTVALKFLSPALTSNWEAQERFVHEAQAASELDHPNICTVHEFDETEAGQMYIAMAYYSGESLKTKIKRGPLGVEEALDIALQLARGLGKAHQHGIVHRDIKPANILMTEDGVAKIVDFGLARLAGTTRVTRTGTTMGTVAYMSPEQAQGHEVDHRTDLWSLGVVLFEMLTGQLPFKGEHEASLLYSIVHEPPQRLKSLKPEVPAELERIVQHALEKNPDSRYASAEEMLKDLKGYQESLRIAETGPFSLRLLLPWARRPRVAIPAIVLLLVLIFLGILFSRRQSRVRWAREVALPEIERLIGNNDCWRNLVPIYRLAEKAEAVIPHDPKLAELFSKCSLKINIKTEPVGAKIYMKEYMTPDSEWTYVGVSPIEKIRLPIGIFRWKIEKEGYETVLAASSTWGVVESKPDPIVPNDLMRVLDKKGSIPAGMVRVPGAQTAIGKVNDFYIDQYEITNKQYREFINRGGYADKKYWKHQFIKDGRELAWEEAVRTFVDQTDRPGPATWQGGDYPEGQGDYPVSGISWYEAAAYAEFVGKNLPTGTHWGIARGEYTSIIQIPQLGGFAILAPFSNFGGKGPVPVGSLPGITSYGAFDMAGNVREWCWNETPKGRLIRGGAWGDNTYMFDSLSQAPPLDRSAKNGFRCAVYPEPEKIPSVAFELQRSPGSSPLGELPDFYKMKPVPDSVFQVYEEQFSYDKSDLKARVESRKESAQWFLEKVSFEAAYGGERVMAWLFLPKNAKPPFQTVIYYGADTPAFHRSSQDIENYFEVPMFFSFLVRSGRAVLYPVYKGYFERGNDALCAVIEGDNKSHQWAEIIIQQVKDFRRSIDYLETRPDIDSRKLAYYGMSSGSELGPIISAVEERLKVNVFLAGGLEVYGRSVNPINYITRVKTPTLMLNGKYDTFTPPETSQKPMFDLLATPAEYKQWKLYETDHIPPVNEFIKETLAWLDRYLGPVR
jgi:serine/threonine protein kinase/cephalosporin-C deacetylase-like acetyl esterase